MRGDFEYAAVGGMALDAAEQSIRRFTEEQFVASMNTRAREIGLKTSVFRNATGWPDPDQHMSARDIATLARRIIIDFPEYYKYDAERSFKYNNIEQPNRHPMVQAGTADGLKTGHTAEAGYCLVTSSKRDGMRLITVILNTHSAQARADLSRTLLAWGYSKFEKATPIQADAVVAQAKVGFGKADTVPAVLPTPWLVTVPRGTQLQTAVEIKPGLEAPIAKGAVVGKVVATANGNWHAVIWSEAGKNHWWEGKGLLIGIDHAPLISSLAGRSSVGGGLLGGRLASGLLRSRLNSHGHLQVSNGDQQTIR